VIAQRLGWLFTDLDPIMIHPAWLASPIGSLFAAAIGVAVLTMLLHVARGAGRAQVALARALLVKPGT
jgi:hypothetical protein